MPASTLRAVYVADRGIRALLAELDIQATDSGHPFDADVQIQPCSVDLRVSNVFWRASRRRRLWRRMTPGGDLTIDLANSSLQELAPQRDWRKIELKEGDSLKLRPGESVMARVYERFTVPGDHAGKIEGRSSYARLGLSVHCTGDFINPGWSGFMPLQLVNAGPYSLKIRPFLPICQLMLVPLSEEPERTYGDHELQSKYVNDDGGPSFWWRDRQVRRVHERLRQFSVSTRLRQEILDWIRFEDPLPLDRFLRFLDTRRVEHVDNAEDLLDAFAIEEDRRRLMDFGRIGTPAVLTSVTLPLFFSGPIEAAIAFAVMTAGSVPLALLGLIRRESGYLGRRELSSARARRSVETVRAASQDGQA